MDIVFRSRRTNVPERFRQHAEGKLAKIGKLDHKAIRIDVEITTGAQPASVQGPGAGRADHPLAGPGRPRRSSRGRPLHRARPGLRQAGESGSAAPATAARTRATATANPCGPGPRPRAPRWPTPVPPDILGDPLDPLGDRAPVASRNGHSRSGRAEESAAATSSRSRWKGECPVVVREKLHHAEPMTIDQALLEMELVGHDFFLFHDRECDQFSVVYRRRGYDYGVIRLVERLRVNGRMPASCRGGAAAAVASGRA